MPISQLPIADGVDALAVVEAGKGGAHGEFGVGSLDRAGSELGVPEEQVGAAAHGELVEGGALEEDVVVGRGDGEELLVRGEVEQAAGARDG